MAIRPKGTLERQLRTVFNLGTIGELTDGQLLERFATRGGEAAELAFAAVVERHGPMVLRVCRHALGDQNDAEDAFQATFLILVKQARSLWVRDSLGPWLHRVAHRVATRARLSAARRREHERRTAAAMPTVVYERGDWDELLSLLHQEIERLPERCRVPVVLCDLQGLTHERAARHLGWPVGTVKSRLARARELLRGRLSRRGMGLPAGLIFSEKGLGGAFTFQGVGVVLPGTLVESTVRAAVPFAAGKALAVGVISSRVAILIEEAQKTMAVTKLKLAAALVLVIGAAGAAGVLAQHGPRPGAGPSPEQAQGPASADSRRAGGIEAVRSPVPAYITESRATILKRLEEEVAEARARLDRTLRKFRSPDNPAVVRTRETLEALVQRLDRIDRVLVDVVETYPTMVDFSGGPAYSDITSQVGLGAVTRGELEAAQSPAVESSNKPERARATDRAEWMNERPDAEQTRAREQQTVGEPAQNNKGQSAGSQNKPGRSEQNSQPGYGEKLNDVHQSGSKGQLKDGDKQNHSGQQGQKSQSQPGDAQNDSGSPKMNGQAQKDDSRASSSRPGQNSQSQKGDSQDSNAKSSGNSPGQPGKANMDKKSWPDSKSRSPGHGSGIVTTDLNGDGEIDVIVFDGDSSKPASKNGKQTGDTFSDTAKQPSKSGEKPGNASSEQSKPGPNNRARPGDASDDNMNPGPKSGEARHGRRNDLYPERPDGRTE